jgi:hypothetical protein
VCRVSRSRGQVGRRFGASWRTALAALTIHAQICGRDSSCARNSLCSRRNSCALTNSAPETWRHTARPASCPFPELPRRDTRLKPCAVSLQSLRVAQCVDQPIDPFQDRVDADDVLPLDGCKVRASGEEVAPLLLERLPVRISFQRSSSPPPEFAAQPRACRVACSARSRWAMSFSVLLNVIALPHHLTADWDAAERQCA